MITISKTFKVKSQEHSVFSRYFSTSNSRYKNSKSRYEPRTGPRDIFEGLLHVLQGKVYPVVKTKYFYIRLYESREILADL